MKYSLVRLSRFFFSIQAILHFSAPTASAATTITGVPYCMNPPYTTGVPLCGGGCGDNEVSASDEEYEASCSSLVLNSGFRYYGWASEYKSPSVGPGCSPCGTGSGQKSDLPSLELNRLYNIRGNDTPFLSFGFATGLERYDVSLRFLANQDPIYYHTFAKADDDRVGRFNAARGGWKDNSNRGPGFYAIHLFTLAGTPITTAADRDLAHTATILHHDGTTIHFEVFWKQDGNAWARPIALMDRHGNAIEITYLDPHFDTVTNPVLDVSPYFKKEKIRDAYGREATLTYIQQSGRNVVDKIVFPDGEEITYEYGGMQSVGNPMVKKATHPDGSETIYTASIDTQSNLVKLNVQDVHADPGSRRKTLLFSRGSGFDGNGQTMSTVRNRIRQIDNGTGELAYLNRLGTTSDKHFIYNGGNMVKKISYLQSNKGMQDGGYITNDLWKADFNQGDTSTWDTKLSLTNRSNNNARMETSKTGSRSRTTDFTRDAITAEIGAKSYPDATTSSTPRNQFTQPLTTTDRLGRQVANTYSALGDHIARTVAPGTADEATYTNVYNTRGQLIEARDALYDPNFPELHNTRYEYDTDGFLVKKIEAADLPAGTRPETLYTYDAAGRLATTTDPSGRLTTLGYDVQSRLVQTTYNDTSTELVEYGTGLEAGLVVKRTDRNGIETTYAYDAADRVIETVTAANTSDPSVETCTYLTGTRRKETCTRDGETTTYLFDHRNRVIGTEVRPDTATTLATATEFDELSRRRSTTDAYGRKTYFLYDQNDRLTRTVTETVPGALAAPAFISGASQSSQPKTYSFTDKDNNQLDTQGTHEVTYTDPRDLFLAGLTRDLSPNAPYLITDSIHDAEGQTLVRTDPRGNRTWMEYDERGRNTLTISALGTPEEIRSETIYDDNSNVIESRKPRYFSENIEARDTFTYTGRNLKETHTTAPGTPEEAIQSWTYYDDGRANEHTDFRGNFLKQIWHACCGRLQATIDRDGQSTAIFNTDFKGQPTHSATVSANPVTAQTPGNSSATADWHNPADAGTLRETTTRFDGRGRPTHTTLWLVARGNVDDDARTNLGDPADIPIAGLDGIPAAEGLTTSYTYDDDLTDGQGIDLDYAAQLVQLAARGITFGPGSDGSATAMTNPEGETSVSVRDGIGRTVMTIDGEGDIRTMRHDEMLPAATFTPAHLTAIPLPGDLLTTTSIDATGDETIRYTDAAGRTILIEDAIGNLSGFAYDANSNRTISRDSNGLGENCVFDALNRDTTCTDLQELAESTTRTKTYNTHGAVLTSTDAEGEVTTITYDVRDRRATSTDANNLTTAYSYDENNNLLTLTDPETKTRSWTYDARNLMVSKAMPDPADTVTHTYDALSRLKIKTAQDNSTVEMIYDLAGRMTRRDYSDATSDTFTYDAASRLLTATKGRHAITTSRTYADDGMVLTETQTLDSRTYTLARSYDSDNLVASQTFADGKVMTWTHDERHLVTAATYDGDPVLSQSHDPGYRLTQQVFGNNLTRNITFGRNDNLRTADTVSAIDELAFSYTYKPDKNLEKENQPNGFLTDLSFTAQYDAGNRITAYDRDDAYLNARENQSWDYDGAGNWDSTTIDGTTGNRTHSASDELQSVAGDNLTYDSRGNLLSDNRDNDYTWDLDNRLVESDGPAYTRIEYRYDALGRGVVRTQGSTKEVLLWWGNTEQAEHKHQAGQTTIQNDLQANPSEQALNTIFARALEGNKLDIQYFHKNYLDHVMAVSDDNGNILEHYRYTAFGEPEFFAPNGTQLTATAIDNDILWNVRRYETANGLYMYLYRHYIASLGRWPSRDPIAERGGVNLYGFVGNDGLNKRDRLGLTEFLDYEDFFDDLSELTGNFNDGLSDWFDERAADAQHNKILDQRIFQKFYWIATAELGLEPRSEEFRGQCPDFVEGKADNKSSIGNQFNISKFAVEASLPLKNDINQGNVTGPGGDVTDVIDVTSIAEKTSIELKAMNVAARKYNDHKDYKRCCKVVSKTSNSEIETFKFTGPVAEMMGIPATEDEN